MNSYFAASTALIYPMSTTGLKIVVTCVQVLSDGTTKVVWTKGNNGGDAKNVNASYTLTTQMNTVARGGYIIAARSLLRLQAACSVQVIKNTVNL